MGLVALAIWLAHGADLASRGEAIDLLWICNMGALLLTLGCLFRQRIVLAVGLLWMLPGELFWTLDMLTGGEILVSSFALHLVIPVLGFLTIRRVGWPTGAWWVASLSLLPLALLTHVASPESRNINLAFHIEEGWEGVFPSFPIYAAVVVGSNVILYRLLSPLIVHFASGTESEPPGQKERSCAT
ncbi:MAG: hypothetical protein GXP55_05445 [Deltaproteobacteria bacterium]|nr:hypothetical protein [Deltaproteobacteria bacterium]